MSTREPSAAAILAARIAKAYPSLSAYSAALLADELCRIERAQHRHAERCCSGADGGYTRPTRHLVDGVTVCDVEHDPDAEERARKRVVAMVTAIMRRFPATTPPVELRLHGDPRGAVLLVRFPGETEARWA